jgi:magnesium-transporting ATPase (P-type)
MQYMASHGYCVIAGTQAVLPHASYSADHAFDRNSYPESGYAFLWLTSLEDLLKHGVHEAIGMLHSGLKHVQEGCKHNPA